MVLPTAVAVDAAAALAERLSRLPELSLPSSLSREPSSATQSQIYRHLTDLLSRDPGVFLERHGACLTAEELAAFEPLRAGSYEVCDVGLSPSPRVNGCMHRHVRALLVLFSTFIHPTVHVIAMSSCQAALPKHVLQYRYSLERCLTVSGKT